MGTNTHGYTHMDTHTGIHTHGHIHMDVRAQTYTHSRPRGSVPNPFLFST